MISLVLNIIKLINNSIGEKKQMNKLSSYLFILVCIAATLISSATIAQNRVESNIDKYKKVVDDWRQKTLPKNLERIAEHETEQEIKTIEKGDHIEILQTRWYEAGNSLSTMIMHDNTKGIVYPGSLIWTGALLEGRLLPVMRLAGTPEVTAVGEGIRPKEDTEFKAHFQFSGIYSSYQEQLHLFLPHLETTAPRLSFNISESKHLTSALLDLGMSAKYWTSKIGGKLHSGKRKESSFLTVAIDQVFFSMIADTPPVGGYFPLTLLNDSNNADYIINTAQSAGEVGYIRRVDYGRKVILTISSNASHDDLRRALSFRTDGPNLKLETSIDSKIREVWENMDVRAYVVGGKVSNAFIDMITGDTKNFSQNLNQFLKDSSTWDSKTVAVPVSFEVAFARDLEPLVTYETVKFSGPIETKTVCNTKEHTPGDIPIATDGNDARCVGGDDCDIHSDDYSKVKVEYKITKSSNSRQVLLNLKWQAWELQKDKRHRAGKNSTIVSEKEFIIFDLKDKCPGATIKSISNVVLENEETEIYAGKVHGTTSFPNFGSLRNIKVAFDTGGDDGKNDTDDQYFEGKLRGLTVWTTPEPTD
jgi:hypothetical protein